MDQEDTHDIIICTMHASYTARQSLRLQRMTKTKMRTVAGILDPGNTIEAILPEGLKDAIMAHNLVLTTETTMGPVRHPLVTMMNLSTRLAERKPSWREAATSEATVPRERTVLGKTMVKTSSLHVEGLGPETLRVLEADPSPGVHPFPATTGPDLPRDDVVALHLAPEAAVVTNPQEGIDIKMRSVGVAIVQAPEMKIGSEGRRKTRSATTARVRTRTKGGAS